MYMVYRVLYCMCTYNVHTMYLGCHSFLPFAHVCIIDYCTFPKMDYIILQFNLDNSNFSTPWMCAGLHVCAGVHVCVWGFVCAGVHVCVWVCVWVCICGCVYLCVYLYMYYVCICMCMYMCICMCICVCVCVCIYVCICIFLCMCMCVCNCVCICVWAVHIFVMAIFVNILRLTTHYLHIICVLYNN